MTSSTPKTTPQTVSQDTLLRARKLQKDGEDIGFVWADTDAAFAKVVEEIQEFKEAMDSGDTAHQAEEWGDLMFCLVNYARMQGLDTEQSLRQANDKFERRFNGMTADLKAAGFDDLNAVPLGTWLEYWKKQKVKVLD